MNLKQMTLLSCQYFCSTIDREKEGERARAQVNYWDEKCSLIKRQGEWLRPESQGQAKHDNTHTHTHSLPHHPQTRLI